MNRDDEENLLQVPQRMLQPPAMELNSEQRAKKPREQQIRQAQRAQDPTSMSIAIGQTHFAQNLRSIEYPPEGDAEEELIKLYASLLGFITCSTLGLMCYRSSALCSDSIRSLRWNALRS